MIHPSMAGVANCAKLRLTSRQQWFGHEDAPKLSTMSVNGRLENLHLPMEVFCTLIEMDIIRKQVLMQPMHTIYWLSRNPIDLNMLSFGISAGFIQYKLDETTFLLDGPDNAIEGIVQSETNFNIDLGFSYQFLDYYAHATVKNLLKNSGINNDIEITSNLRRYLFSVGGVFGKYGSEWTYEPSVMFQYKEGTEESSIDINGKVYKQMPFGSLWGGVSYRNSFDGAQYLDGSGTSTQKLKQITPLLGVNYNQFMFAYTYTYQLNSIVFTNGGFHQLSVGYNFNCRKEKYDCNCPAVN